jgi:hypothetical protein
MKASEQLTEFVGRALEGGRDRAAIAAALTVAGWTQAETRAALAAWSEADFKPPIPRPQPQLSARDAYRYGLIFVALMVVAGHLVWLCFYLIDMYLVDVTESFYTRQYRIWELRWSTATLITFTPVFLYLNFRSITATRADPSLRRSTVRRWLGFLTLFVASIAFLSDLVTAIYYWLNGELSLRFVLKVLVVAVVSGAVFLFFRSETQEPSNET